MGFFNLFGNQGEEVSNFLQRGAVVIDVRTPQEYKGGHVNGAINIPLDSIRNRMNEIKNMNKPIITCCASGARSGSAAAEMKSNGIEAMNGGSWMKVDRVKNAG